jgi:hypothetical protein
MSSENCDLVPPAWKGVRRKNYHGVAVGDVLDKGASRRPTGADVFFNEIGERFPFRDRLRSGVRKSLVGAGRWFSNQHWADAAAF